MIYCGLCQTLVLFLFPFILLFFTVRDRIYNRYSDCNRCWLYYFHSKYVTWSLDNVNHPIKFFKRFYFCTDCNKQVTLSNFAWKHKILSHENKNSFYVLHFYWFEKKIAKDLRIFYSDHTIPTKLYKSDSLSNCSLR